MSPVIQPVLAELRRRLERVYGSRLVRMILFGSQARGEADAGSDVDVMVVLDGPVSPCEEIARTVSDVAGVSLDLGAVISCVFVSRDRFERERSPLLLNVRREGVPV
jgi:predicted nucleotidyltransferase